MSGPVASAHARRGPGEVGGGLLTFLGLGGALGPVIVVPVMPVAIGAVHLGKASSRTRAFELPALYVAGALAVAFAGGGAYTLDRLVGVGFLSDPRQIWYALAAAVVAAR